MLSAKIQDLKIRKAFSKIEKNKKNKKIFICSPFKSNNKHYFNGEKFLINFVIKDTKHIQF